MSMFSKTIAVWVGMASISAGSLRLEAARPQDAVPASSRPAPAPATRSQVPSPSTSLGIEPRALLDQYCVVCHNGKLRTAGLELDAMDVGHIAAGAEVWEKVVGKLRMAAMPPVGMPRPDRATYDVFATWLETELDRAAAVRPNPGRPTVHRLNRTEYANAVRDILALEIDGSALLPADEAGYGFDNIADVLSMSPGLLERYLIAAQKISRLAVGDPTIGRSVDTYTLPKNREQTDRISDDLPFRSRGGDAIRHYFPVDGEYMLKLRLQRQFNVNEVRGLDRREQIEVRLDGERIKVFTVGGDCVEQPKAPKCQGADTLLGSEYERMADEGLEVRFSAKAGMRVVGVSFLERIEAPEGLTPARLPIATHSYWEGGYDRAEMGIDTVRIQGPFNVTGPGDTSSRRRIFSCRPAGTQDHRACATKILSTVARRAYRRPVAAAEVQTLLTFYDSGWSEGGFEAGIQSALERVLVAPEFLFRAERDPAKLAPGVPYRLADLELASRLSFFLWSSVPDDELIDVAARGRLSDPTILEQQVRRMLADDRATALVTNFGGQWLYLRNVGAMRPDSQKYPEFDENLREAFARETELFLDSQLRDDRSVLDLLRADYTFLNERLARHYGIPHVYGNHFRRVRYPDDRRAGLLGQGSILTVTSYATRTSPVVRGKWLLETLLAAPPAAPPPNVPPLKENDAVQPTTVRERLQQHRRNPVCATCHNRMDPLGFALENFDAIGMWRTTEGGIPVDASGVLPDGSKFNGPAEFRKALLANGDLFVNAVTEKLLTFALGRGIEYYDRPAIRAITREAAAGDYRWSSLILGIVRSMPFQMRTVAPARESAAALSPSAQQIRRLQ